MKNLKDIALEISNRFPFSPVPQPIDEHGKIIPVVSDIDEEFMKCLERGEDLDTDKLPL